MFHKFTIVSKPRRVGKSPTAIEVNKNATKIKRKQVSKACDSCRILRSKCDDHVPCSLCIAKGLECRKDKLPRARRKTHSGSSKPEDANLSGLDLSEKSSTTLQHSRCSSPEQSFSEDMTRTHSSTYGCSPEGAKHEIYGYYRPKKGITVKATCADNPHYYGPSSTIVLIDWIVSSLNSVSKQPGPSFSIDSLLTKGEAATCVNVYGETPKFVGFPRRQEEMFLETFWQTYYCTIPVIDENAFQDNLASLWSSSLNEPRMSSPLVDIVLAICIQYARSFVQDACLVLESSDILFAGVGYYRRCQTALVNEGESPSLATVQCYIFMVVYLQNAGWINMAYHTLGIAVRIAQTVGIHLEPPSHLSQADQDLRKRIWRALYIIDTRLGIELGRPWAISEPHITFPDQHQAYPEMDYLKPSVSSEGVTWLDFNVQEVKLFRAVRFAHAAFYSESGGLLKSHVSGDVPQIRKTMDAYAERFTDCMKPLHTWLRNLPDGLKTRRDCYGDSLPANGKMIDHDVDAPRWLQVQRVTLELLYHNAVLTFYRQFIPAVSDSLRTPLPETHARAALNSALTVTYLSRTILTEFDIFNGWYEACRTLWQASLVLIAYSLAYPLSSEILTQQKSIICAASVFDIWGANCPSAAKSASVLREIEPRLNRLVVSLQTRENESFDVNAGDISSVHVEAGV